MNKYMNDLTSWFKKLLLIICLNMRYPCFCLQSMELSHYFVTMYTCDPSIGYGLIWGKRGPFHLLVPSLQTYLLVYKATDSRDLGQLNNCANKHESSYEISSHVSSVARLCHYNSEMAVVLGVMGNQEVFKPKWCLCRALRETAKLVQEIRRTWIRRGYRKWEVNPILWDDQSWSAILSMVGVSVL